MYPYPNFQPGLIRSGTYTDKIFFGGTKESDAGKASYETILIDSTTHLAADLIKKNIKVTATLFNWDDTYLTPFRVIVQDTITLDAGGLISADGGGGAQNNSSTGGTGFTDANSYHFGTLGGSGSGGSRNEIDPGFGGNGHPTAFEQVAKRWGGGSGGNGGITAKTRTGYGVLAG